MLIAYLAPGKALLCGGYLVLDPQYSGYVTALSTRMHCREVPFSRHTELPEARDQTETKAGAATNTKSPNSATLKIISPQFKNAVWTYSYSAPFSGLTDTLPYKPNKFLKAALDTILAYISPTEAKSLCLEIFLDPGYHSGGSFVKSSRFALHNEEIEEVPKTGLGSSAGLVVVVTAAVLLAFGLLALAQTVHNLAQIGHCAAQGKIGSGFDVAAAVYGLIEYRRFSPELLKPFLEAPASKAQELRKLVDSKWDMLIEPCKLPPSLRILMGDVKSGSDTRGMVKQVKEWAANGKGDHLFKELDLANHRLITSLRKLHEAGSPDAHLELAKYLLIQLKHVIKDDPRYLQQAQPYLDVVEAILGIRNHIQQLTRLSGASVEPASQTVLLDNCYTLPGVLGGVVPGAGGFDAICLLVLAGAPEEIKKLTKKGGEGGEFSGVGGFNRVDLEGIDLRVFEGVEWLDLQETSGMQTESPDVYKGWD